jgi:hypothetical protein
MNLHYNLILLAGLLAAPALQADVLAAEDFSGDVATTILPLLAGTNKGVGWAGPWEGSASIEVIATSWATLTGYAPYGDPAAEFNSAIGSGATISRPLSQPIDTQAVHTVYWSFQFTTAQNPFQPNWLNLLFDAVPVIASDSCCAEPDRSIVFQIDGNAQTLDIDARDFNASQDDQMVTGMTVDQNGTNLIVGRMDFGPAGDVFSVAILKESDDISQEPLWESGAANIARETRINYTGVFNHVGWRWGVNADTIAGSLRIGETWEDVIGAESGTPMGPGPFAEWPLVNGFVDTGSWLGQVYTPLYPWVFVEQLDAFLYSGGGQWFFVPRS